jgi:MFS family permease
MEDVKEANLTPSIEPVGGSDEPRTPELKQDHGVTLIPRPSDDPRDPLNWPMSKKVGIVAVLCLAVFSGFVAPLAGQLNVKPQSTLYQQSTTHIAWQNSAASAGLATGGFFFAPISFKLGRSSVIFWTLIACLLTQIWGAEMTHKNQFNGFIVSRFFSGFFGGVTGVLGPRILVDLFFLHQRGRAFTAFHWCLNFGSVAGPTLSAYISSNRSWTLEFWWTVGLLGVAIISCLLFMHETAWVREPDAVNSPAPDGFFANRFATFFPGTRVTPKSSARQTARIAAIPFLVLVSPVVLIMSVFTLISFGFYIAMNALTPVFLQKPVKIGGYGFSTVDSANFSFVHWIGIIIALIYGHFVSDRLPLAICARNGGVWKPEYRLHALWVPALIFNPIGLGLFGAALQYHLHWIVIAVGQVFVTFGSLSLIPVTVNYIVECFKSHPAEASITTNALRLVFGLSVAFYINDWVADVDVGWTYGMMAFFDVFSFGFIGILMWKGHQIREWTVGGLNDTEEGEKVIETAKLVES